MAKEINDQNFEETISSAKVAVVDFWAEWCGPCRMVGPIIDEISNDPDLEGQAVIGKCNVDENADSSVKFGIRNIPTVLFFKDGQLVDKLVGVNPKSAYLTKIKEHLK